MYRHRTHGDDEGDKGPDKGDDRDDGETRRVCQLLVCGFCATFPRFP